VKDLKGGFKAAGKLGKNKPTEMFRALAHQCGFANAERFTSRSARRTGISLLGKSGVNQHVINQKARHSDTSTNALYNDPHESSLAAAAIALHYKPPGKSFAIHAILHTFCYSLFFFYEANVVQDKSKENLSPNFQMEQTMAPSLSLAPEEVKPPPAQIVPSTTIACSSVMAPTYPPAQMNAQAPNPYGCYQIPQFGQQPYFSGPPAPHSGYLPPHQGQPAVYYQPQAAPMQHMAPQPMYHPYGQQPPQPVVSYSQPPPSSVYPPQQAVYYQVPQVPGPAQYTHPYPHQPAAVPHYHYPPQHPPTEGV
jgi:hypothetical protein